MTQTARSPQMPLRSVKQFMEILGQCHPNAQTELIYNTPFELLVSVVLSAQATDISVNKATKKLFEDAPNAVKMAELGAENIAPYIKTIGLWRSKAENLAKLSQQLLQNHQGEVPQERSALEALAGVGRKTANVVLNVAFGQPTMAVDTHIFRIGNRTGLAPGKNVREVEEKLVKRIPQEHLRPAHNWLILHGRYLCKARTPECWRCPVIEFCLFKEKNLIEPPKKKK